MDREKNVCFKPNNNYLHTAMWVIGSAEGSVEILLIIVGLFCWYENRLPIERKINKASTIGVVRVREKVY